MLETLKKLFRIFISRNFLMYVAIGTFNTLNTAILSQILALIINDNFSSYLAYLLSLSIGYLLNAKVNFHRNLLWREYFKFLSVYIPHFIIFAVISTIAISVFDFPPFWATVLASVTGSPITYVIMRFFAFDNRKK